jgi:glyoxylase-like metal-dependent hydrolase (beta-lactamase superfamily II)/ferredoxin
MSDKYRLTTNVQGDFFVNSACINCDTCRQLAPTVFSEIGNYSAVTKQPISDGEERSAFHALLACPTAAIQSAKKEGSREAMADFPLLIDDDVYYCGYTSPKSYGGSSYFIVHPDGNWLVDSPRYVPSLVKKFEEMGGIRYIFLTHQDDVADAALYAAHFQSDRMIHELEKHAQPDAEFFIQGTDPVDWKENFRFIPGPGHTRGHMTLLYKQKYLFTGDHLAWNHITHALEAWEDFCWFSWEAQCKSMKQLALESFEWVLPGHGERVHLEASRMKHEMARLLAQMKV